MSVAKADDPAAAASQLEAYFLRRMLSEVHTGEGLTGGGFAGGMFKDMLDEAISDTMAKAGGVGIADSMMEQLDPDGTSATDSATDYKYGNEEEPPLSGASPRMAPGPTLAPGASLDGVLSAQPLDRMPTTSSFGARHDPIDGDVRQHRGLDLGAPVGTPVHAAAAGTVTRAGDAGTYGNLVVIDQGNGVETRYAHMSEVDVQVGQKVAAGADVGKVGQTGRTTGPHLHFEVRKGGQALDPADQIFALKTRSGRPTQ